MPIYEFYCPDCNVLFNFYSRRADTDKVPACPRCARPSLERKPSRFACSRGLKEEEDAGLPGMDEDRMEKAMMELAGEAEGVDENDPRAMARLMRKMYDSTGQEMTGGVEEAIRRMEAGEDPEAVEASMGDALEEETPFGEDGLVAAARKRLSGRARPPRRDETLYEL